MKIKIKKREPKVEIRDATFFLDYLKIMGMMLFAISMTTPVIGLILFDFDTEITEGKETLIHQLIWDKPILPFIAGFGILLIQWFKFTEVHHSLKTTDIKHILITFGFFFLLSLYPYFEMNIEFTSDQPHSRASYKSSKYQSKHASSSSSLRLTDEEQLMIEYMQIVQPEVLEKTREAGYSDK